MKKFYFVMLSTVALFVCATVQAKGKKEEAPKEKKEYVWNWDGKLSGDATFDSYLNTVDGLWKKMENYEKTFGSYTYSQDTLAVDGEYYIMAYMQDAKGNYLTRSAVNWQLVESVASSIDIVTSATSAAASTATASAALPGLGMNAVKFGKYVKGGPMVIAKGMKTMKGVWMDAKNNAKSWKSLKNGSIDASTLGIFSDNALATMSKCSYVKKIEHTDECYEEVAEVMKNKSKEELDKIAKDVAANVEKAIILPEEAGKQCDDVSDDAMKEFEF